MRLINSIKNIKNTINRSFKDPIAALLLKYSNLTNTQYESLIIDFISDNISDKRLTYSDKTLLRSKTITSGSFRRTLSQARRNVISSIYTILLLSYVGIFDSTPFDDYKNISEKLSEYISIFENSTNISKNKFLQRIEVELLEGIRTLSKPKNIKQM